MTAFTLYWEAQIVAILVVFARLGTALMFMPGFGEMQIPGRHRLVLALMLSVGLRSALPVITPDTPVLLAALILREALIGLYLGLGARMLFTALHVLGAVISHVTTLSNAMAAGNTGYEGSSALSSLLIVAGVALIFVTDSHHLMLRGLFHSYALVPPGWMRLDDLAMQMAQIAMRGLYLAAMLGAPFFILGILLNLGLGVANRVMPNMPILMIAGPAVVMLGLGLLMLAQEAILGQFIQAFADALMSFGRSP